MKFEDEYDWQSDADFEELERRDRALKRTVIGIGVLLFVVCTLAGVSAAVEIMAIERAAEGPAR